MTDSDTSAGAISRSDIEDLGDQPWRDEDLLRMLYVEEKMSLNEVSEVLDCAYSTVRNWLKKHDIETRSIGDGLRVKRNGSVYVTPLHTYPGGHVKWRASVNGEDKPLGVHRLLAVAEYGFDAVRDKVVHHKNDIPWDNRTENLELMTWGEHTSHHHTKLTQPERLAVAALYDATDLSSRDVGEVFDVANGTVLRVHKEEFGE